MPFFNLPPLFFQYDIWDILGSMMIYYYNPPNSNTLIVNDTFNDIPNQNHMKLNEENIVIFDYNDNQFSLIVAWIKITSNLSKNIEEKQLIWQICTCLSIHRILGCTAPTTNAPPPPTTTSRFYLIPESELFSTELFCCKIWSM